VGTGQREILNRQAKREQTLQIPSKKMRRQHNPSTGDGKEPRPRWSIKLTPGRNGGGASVNNRESGGKVKRVTWVQNKRVGRRRAFKSDRFVYEEELKQEEEGGSV